jgi:hypothetical protein
MVDLMIQVRVHVYVMVDLMIQVRVHVYGSIRFSSCDLAIRFDVRFNELC